MTFVNACVEREELGGRHNRATIALKPVAYPDASDAGRLKRIVATWADSGVTARPHIVTASQMMVSVGDDGLRRIHPTREADRYMEIGAPYVKVAGVWQKVGFTGATRTANSITWHRPQADLCITHGGHFVKLDLELLGGYVPEQGRVAFPVGLTGLTRSGGNILADDKTVALLRAPVVQDAGNPMGDTRPIAYEFTTLVGQPYLVMTLPSLMGMSRPVIDPTLVLQPDAAAGIDTQLFRGNDAGQDDTPYPTVTSSAFGQNTNVWCQHALIKFDLTGIPVGATVSTVTFYLYRANANTEWDSAAYDFWYRVLVANSAWTEAQATWKHCKKDTNAHWAGDAGADGGVDAGCSQSGTDYDSTELGHITVPADDASPTGTEYSCAFNLTEFAEMQVANYGMLGCGSRALNYHSMCLSDHATAGYRPKLVVDYTLPAGAALFQAPFIGPFRPAF